MRLSKKSNNCHSHEEGKGEALAGGNLLNGCSATNHEFHDQDEDGVLKTFGIASFDKWNLSFADNNQILYLKLYKKVLIVPGMP